MSLLTPLALIAGLLAIPIILLYMLRLRRREISISSTFLWQQVLRDREANTPWQRLRRSLLLLLQLLILALLVLALARPYVTVPTVTTGQTVLLLDASASMNATDSPNGSRFAQALAEAHVLIDTLRAGDSLSIIRVSDTPEVIIPYTSDPAPLHAAVDALSVSSAPADWNAAFTLAAAGSAGTENFNVVVISDGNLGTTTDFPPIPGDIEFIPVGSSGDNLAISALAVRALPGQPAQLFAEVTNHSSQSVEAIFSLTLDGTLLSAERYTLAPNSRLPVVYDDLPTDYRSAQAALTLPAGSTFVDRLALDNQAFTIAPMSDARRVLLMSQGNRFLEQVLRSLPGVRTFQGDTAGGIPTGNYDLIVLDGWLPPTLPQTDLLIINPPSESELFSLGAVIEPVSEIRVQRGDPRMLYVDFDDVNLLRFRQVFASWASPLITTNEGPLLLAGETGGRQVALLSFDLRDSDLPLQITFPILISSLLSWFSPLDVIDESALSVGEPIALRPPLDAAALEVIKPDGSPRAVMTGANPVFADTAQLGLYTLNITRSTGGVDTIPFAVNLFAPSESAIAPQASITLGSTEISPETAVELGQQEFWPWLALAALAVLMLEWWVYHRNQRTPTTFKPLESRLKARGQ